MPSSSRHLPVVKSRQWPLWENRIKKLNNLQGTKGELRTYQNWSRFINNGTTMHSDRINRMTWPAIWLSCSTLAKAILLLISTKTNETPQYSDKHGNALLVLSISSVGQHPAAACIGMRNYRYIHPGAIILVKPSLVRH